VWFNEPHLTRALELVDVLRGIAARRRCTVAEVAIAWTLRHPAVTGAIVGARRPEQIDGFIGAVNVELSEIDLGAIDRTSG
jgi:aryl-alcohol dehydrogenase-like predicted oxidoreductase